MKTVIVLSCIFAMAFSAPVPKKLYKIQANIPSLLEVEASNPEAAVRKARQLFELDIDIYNNNGNGYFDNGGGGYGGDYGGYGGGYGGYGGDYGGYGGGYGGYGGYGGGCCG